MGALEFIPPAAEEMEKPFKVEIADLYLLARAALNEAKDFKAEYNIKGADSLIKKAIGVVSDYQRYAHIAGVDGYWSHQIKEEINDRIEKLF